MHEAVKKWVVEHLPREYDLVIEAGSKDINGSARDLVREGCRYVGVDPQPGRGVDVVGDFASYQHEELADLVICTEVLEHARNWREIIASAARNLKPGGVLIVTCATHGRPPHSGIDESPIRSHEWYENVDPSALLIATEGLFSDVSIDVLGTDLRACCTR